MEFGWPESDHPSRFLINLHAELITRQYRLGNLALNFGDPTPLIRVAGQKNNLPFLTTFKLE